MLKNYTSFFFLQLKSAVLLLPRLSLILVFCLLFVSGILAAGRELMKQPADLKLPTALVLPENDTYAELAFSFLEGMDSIRSTCSFERTNKEQAYSLLKSGEVYAVILIPDSFIEHILDGTNSSATLLLPKQGSLESILFVTLADAGASTLSTAQAGIYAIEDVLISCEKWDEIAKVEKELNKRYLSYALNRSRMFETETVSATDNLSLADYYICSGITLFLLLSCMAGYSYFHAESVGLRLLLDRQGISPVSVFLLKLLAISIVYTIFLFTLAVPSGLLTFSALGHFFLLVLSTQAMLMLLSMLCPHAGNYYIIATSLSTVCLFLSGAFIPSVFLPDAVRDFGNLLPTAFLLKLCRGIL